MILDESKIDWSMLEKIEDQKQKAFFTNIKARMESGEEIEPNQLIESITSIVSNGDNAIQEKLVKINESMKKATEALKQIKF